jgi:hypothetical protein
MLTSTTPSKFRTLFEFNFHLKKNLAYSNGEVLAHYDLCILAQNFVEVLNYRVVPTQWITHAFHLIPSEFN